MSTPTVSSTPTQQAVNGAMDIFVAGFRRDQVWQRQVGLSVLARATEEQVREAMRFVEAHGRAAVGEIEAMLAA